jgi:hypothetical protein
MTPASLTTSVLGLCRSGHRITFAGYDLEMAQNKELFDFIMVQPMNPIANRQSEFDVSLQIVTDLLLLASRFQRLSSDRSNSEQRFDVGQCGWIDEFGVALRERFEMDGTRSTKMAPSFIGGKRQDRSEQPHEVIENRVHDSLGGSAPSGVWSIAIHAIFRDIDVQTAQLDCTELVEGMINFVEFVALIRLPALVSYFLQTSQ